MKNELHFAVVEVHMSPWEAHVSRALLESEGIPAFLATEHHVAAYWPLSLVLGGVRLLVPAGSAALARDVLAMRDSGELQAALTAQLGLDPDTCSRCGSTEFVEKRDGAAIALSFVFLLLCRAIYPPAKNRKCASCGHGHGFADAVRQAPPPSS